MANEQSGGRAVGRRYANALIESGQKQGVLADIDRDLTELAALLRDNGELRRVLRDPGVGHDELRGVIDALSKAAGWAEITRSFLALVVGKRRQVYLSAMIEAYRIARAKLDGRQTVQTVFARAPSEEARLAASDFAARYFGPRAEVSFSVDPSLIGGIVLRSGSQLVDGSVRGTLEHIRMAMRETL